ncbi:MAG: hypothetical protein PUE04_03505 [Lachnospira sp.]|nr:hypothetical protein [Lachnospira sp.]
MQETRMILHRLPGRAATGFTTFGSYFERGAVHTEGLRFHLSGEGGEIPVQSRITAYWPDGSVKWAAHTADAGCMGSEVRLRAVNGESSGRGDENGCEVTQTPETLDIVAGSTRVRVHRTGEVIFSDLYTEGRLTACEARLVLLLEHRSGSPDFEKETGVPPCCQTEERTGRIHSAEVVEKGPLRVVVKITGSHAGEIREDISRLPVSDDVKEKRTGTESRSDEMVPFTLYMQIFRDCRTLHFSYSFGYDGDEKKDFLKGIGLSVRFPITGALYNRHIRVLTDHGSFHEAGQMMLTWRPRIPRSVYYHQMQGEFLYPDPETEDGKELLAAAAAMPSWDAYLLWQDSADHYQISKKTGKQDVCEITGLHGHRSDGVVAVGGENGGLVCGIKDFWQRYPSAVRVFGMTQDTGTMQLWFWPPASPAADFRHYEDTGYSQTYYEGFDVCGASAYGIAATCEFELSGFTGRIPREEELARFDRQVQKKALYMASPEYYHRLRAFGYWSLPRRSTPAEAFLEDQLDEAVNFYLREQDERSWYGMFDYGDFMHTYDPERHVWRYDMGGYAWQNTELVPTYWLWYEFLRTQRTDIFEMAAAMTRHCSEIDIYHFGPLKGLGSRHNVRHWGCSCKEARIAMAGHDRFLYYLTGDFRLADVMDELSDAQNALLVEDPLRFFADKSRMSAPTHARSGPDWSSLVSDWMSAWERTGDVRYKQRILNGIADLKAAPHGLLSGPDFEFDPGTFHLIWKGDRKTGGSHLMICQGAEQTWLELTQLLDDPEWTRMLAELGAFYTLTNAEQNRLTDGAIGQRQFTYPFMAAGLVAFAARYYRDRKLGEKVWQILVGALPDEVQDVYFRVRPAVNKGNRAVLYEIPGVTTNVFSQWCLNTIVALEFVRDDLPERFAIPEDEMAVAYRRKD